MKHHNSNNTKLYFLLVTNKAKSIFAICLLAMTACSGGQNESIKKIAKDSTTAQQVEPNLTVFGGSLESFDEQGRPVWKVQAKQAKYTQDRQLAQAQNPTGELYQDGKVVYQVTANLAEVQRNGKHLFLKGQIVATDPTNGVVLRGNELEWRPKEDLLIVRNQLTGTHKQVQAVAQEARARTRKQEIELLGRVVANATDPQLQLRTEHVKWLVKEDKLIGDKPLQIDRFKNRQVTDRATGNAAVVDLRAKTATLKQNAQLALLQPPLQIFSNSATWNLNTETVVTNAPVRIVDRSSQTVVTANRGQLNTQQQVAYLTGSVKATGQRRQTVNANQLTWFLPQQRVEAEGNVVYRQLQPPVSLSGQKGVGNLQNDTISITGGNTGRRVVTEIIP